MSVRGRRASSVPELRKEDAMRIGVTLPQRESGMGTDLGAVREYVQATESLGY